MIKTNMSVFALRQLFSTSLVFLCYFKSLLKCAGTCTCIHECLIPVIVPYNCHLCISELLQEITFFTVCEQQGHRPACAFVQAKCYTVNIQPNRLLDRLLMCECYIVANHQYKVSSDVTHFVRASSCDDKQHGQSLHILLQFSNSS